MKFLSHHVGINYSHKRFGLMVNWVITDKIKTFKVATQSFCRWNKDKNCEKDLKFNIQISMCSKCVRVILNHFPYFKFLFHQQKTLSAPSTNFILSNLTVEPLRPLPQTFLQLLFIACHIEPILLSGTFTLV